MRLDKMLAHSGIGTRKQVKKLLKSKIVEVNGKVETSPKVHVNPDEDTVMVNGEELFYQEFVYYMLNKPQGVISATEDDLHDTVLDILEPADIVQEPHPVGRLDIDTEGLLILTNDGKLTHQLTSPRRYVKKKYLAEIDGIVTEDDVEKFKEGLEIEEDFTAMPADLNILTVNEEENISDVEIVIQEGKFHQVKRMFEAVGKEVLYLKRLSMGQLELDPGLELGSYRELTKEEIKLLENSGK